MIQIRAIYVSVIRAVINFWVTVALIFTPVTNLLLYGWIVPREGNFTHNIKGLPSILSRNKCLYGLRPLMTALANYADTNIVHGYWNYPVLHHNI